MKYSAFVGLLRSAEREKKKEPRHNKFLRKPRQCIRHYGAKNKRQAKRGEGKKS
jgi:CRISPR/Cas system-associated endoribonuclease Cas2